MVTLPKVHMTELKFQNRASGNLERQFSMKIFVPRGLLRVSGDISGHPPGEGGMLLASRGSSRSHSCATCPTRTGPMTKNY